MRDSYLPDTILYKVETQPGGVDGLDASAKGGEIVFATFDAAAAEKERGKDSRLLINKSVVDGSDVQAALNKLSTVERFLIEQHFKSTPRWRDPDSLPDNG